MTAVAAMNTMKNTIIMNTAIAMAAAATIMRMNAITTTPMISMKILHPA